MKPWQKAARNQFARCGMMLKETETAQKKLSGMNVRIDVMRSLFDETSPIVTAYCEMNGLSLRTMTLAQLHDLNYCQSWCNAWGKSVVEYLQISTGQMDIIA